MHISILGEKKSHFCVLALLYRPVIFFQQNFTRNQEAVAKEMREDADAYRRKVDLEEHTFHRLLETDETQNQKTQKVKIW